MADIEELLYNPGMLKNLVRQLTKEAFAPILYRRPASGLRPRRLHIWLDSLAKTESVPGAVIEIGVASGGTAVLSHKFLREGGDDRPYICIDTFSGFVPSQYAADVELGNSWGLQSAFSDNPKRLVRRVLDMHGAKDVRLIQSNISQLPQDQIPATISACLIDVDLAIPVYDGLKLIWPKLSSGGLIAVDDCLEHYNWRAIDGVNKFCLETGNTARFHSGMAILQKT